MVGGFCVSICAKKMHKCILYKACIQNTDMNMWGRWHIPKQPWKIVILLPVKSNKIFVWLHNNSNIKLEKLFGWCSDVCNLI